MISVLMYYKSEWTDISGDDTSHRFTVTNELEQIIKDCIKRGTNIPNAAKEVEIFLDLQDTRHNADTQSDSKPFSKTLNIDFGSLSMTKDIHIEPKPKKSEDELDA